MMDLQSMASAGKQFVTEYERAIKEAEEVLQWLGSQKCSTWNVGA